MRPYLAIIKDAFRAALASRVLYVLLLLISIILLAIAPLHVYETLDWRIDADRHIANTPALVSRLLKQSASQPVLARIYERLPQDLQKKLTASANSPVDAGKPQEDDPAPRPPRRPGEPPRPADPLARELATALNQIIEQSDFYDAEIWKGKFLSDEAQQLVDQGIANLSATQRNRLHRLLVTTALSPDLQAASSTYLDTYYAVWRVPFLSAPSTLQQFAQGARATISLFFDKFVLSIGLFVAILVTSNMIPETFEPGSLNLLLSKPVHRWALLISKFLGGCAFVAVLAVYLFLGVWLWLGLAVGIWDRAMLWSIPLYILVFAIYFSVSVLVGIIWRSAVVSVILTALFWAFCFAIGTIYGRLNCKMENERLVKVVDLGSQVVAVDALQRLFVWSDTSKEWTNRIKPSFSDPGQEIGIGIAMFLGEMPPFPVVAPVFDDNTQQSFVLSSSIFDPESMGQARFFWAENEQLNFSNLGSAPYAAVQILQTRQGTILVGGDGSFYRVQGPLGVLAPVEPSPPAPTGNAKIPNASSKTALSRKLIKCGPTEPQVVAAPDLVAYNSQRDEIFVCRRGQLYAFAANAEGQYQLVRQKKVESGSSDPLIGCRMATGGNAVMLVFGNGQIVTLQADTFTETSGYRCEARSPAMQVAASSDGRWFAILYRNGRTWILDTEHAEQMKLASVDYQGLHRGISFDSKSQLLLCHSFDRLSRVDLSSGQTQQVLAPDGDFLKSSYRYVVRPFYKVCPKPGEFYKLVNHLSTTADTSISADVDLTQTDNYDDPWSPLWTGLAFMGMTLFLACIYFQRSDY